MANYEKLHLKRFVIGEIRVMLVVLLSRPYVFLLVHLRVPVQRHRRHGSQTKRNAFRSFLKCKDEFVSQTEAGRVFPDSWSSDAERPVAECSSRPRNFQYGRAGRAHAGPMLSSVL